MVNETLTADIAEAQSTDYQELFAETNEDMASLEDLRERELTHQMAEFHGLLPVLRGI